MNPPEPALSPFLLLHRESRKDLERKEVGSSTPANPWTPLPKTKPLEGVQERWPVQPPRAVLSHAEAPATARTL